MPIYLRNSTAVCNYQSYEGNKPKLLKIWANSNKTVSKLLEDMEIQKDDLDKKRKEEILVEVEDSSLQISQNGYYILIWNTEIEQSKIESCFKRKTLKVISRSFKHLELIGYKLEKINQYILYLKNKGELII